MVDAARDAARKARKAQARDARAARILEAAAIVLATSGISGVTMRAVAAKAGYTAGAVYNYFASREALLAAIAADELDVLAKAMRQQPANLGDLSRACTRALRRVVPLLVAARSGDVPAETERVLTGRVIAVLRLLDAAMPTIKGSSQALDVIALWSGLTGIALMADSGRFGSLNVDDETVLAALIARFES
ncbi:helix-turn-helix domain-containing protein [Pyruvatibacter sp.]|uniref:TetR/AcrR family transcriptional regulator n=1 Tax=Pyruvatibacter sp. TaxID=1981328 RepID=UPI0032EC82E4